MKLETPINANYAATVVRLPELLELAGCDNLLGAPLYGFQAVVDKSHVEGELGIMFPAETQLSLEFTSNNNLHRHADLNIDKGETGYLEDNRRVRAIKLRGHRSDCLFLPMKSLDYLGLDLSDLKEGDLFDSLDGKQICKKYAVVRKSNSNRLPQEKKFSRVDPRLFPEHVDTDNYWRNSHLISPDTDIVVTQKVHGTSWRGTRTLVLRKLTLKDRIAKRLGVTVDEHEWDSVAGSRKVIKDIHNSNQNHFYNDDIWTDYLGKVEHLIPEGFVLYGEIIGWTPNNAAIQSNYTYDHAPGTCSMLVYRITTVNVRGIAVDLSWDQVKEFCDQNGFQHVPELWRGKHSDFVVDHWIDIRYKDVGFNQAVSLGAGNKKLVDEGVVIRAEGLRPTLLKAKSPIFLAHETKLLDKGEVNLEDEGSTTENVVDA